MPLVPLGYVVWAGISGVVASGLAYLKGRFDLFQKSPVQNAFSSPFMLGLTVVLGFMVLAYFKQIKGVLKGAFK